jgi:Macrocin-O-methyltransferase (TylF)
MIERTRLLDGELADCGVFRGASLIAIGIYLQQQQIAKTVYGFDSFQGFDEPVNYDAGLPGEEAEHKFVGGLAILLSNW